MLIAAMGRGKPVSEISDQIGWTKTGVNSPTAMLTAYLRNCEGEFLWPYLDPHQ
jgi:hypothetical protein